MVFRWGSCGKNGVLFFNWKVLQLPVRLADYVIAHELVHLVEGHHGPAFWATLGRAMPDWQKRKEALASIQGIYEKAGHVRIAAYFKGRAAQGESPTAH